MEWLERNRKSVIIAVVLVIAFAAGYFFYKSRNAEQGRLILYGNVDIRQISLAFNSNGRIEEMLKEEGDAVKAGDVLARLDNRPLELAIAQKKAAIAQQEAVKIIPPDRILLETDAPYLTPRGIPGLKRTNVPQNIVYVARALAHYMGVSEENVIRHAKINTERIFGL